MIDQALTFLSHSLNNFLKRKLSIQKDLVLLSSLKDELDNTGKLIITVVGMEKGEIPYKTYPRNSEFNTSSSINMNISLLLSAVTNKDHYQGGLSILSSGIAYFSANSIMNRGNSPDLPEGVENIVIETQSISISERSELWAMLDTSYLPSILYKVHILGNNNEDGEVPSISEVSPIE